MAECNLILHIYLLVYFDSNVKNGVYLAKMHWVVCFSSNSARKQAWECTYLPLTLDTSDLSTKSCILCFELNSFEQLSMK